MNDALHDVDLMAIWALWIGLILASGMAVVVIVGRVGLFAQERFLRGLRRRYVPLIDRALAGDADAVEALVRSPARHRLELARLLVSPLVDDRRPERIAATRHIVDAMELVSLADRWRRSRRWWRKAPALRAIGLMQLAERAPDLVAALDDADDEVRNAALDALTDLRHPATVAAIVVRLHDTSLQRGRRNAALAALGPACEGFLLGMAHIDPERRLDYAKALAICGTAQSRPTLCEWAADPRAAVRAAALESLGRIGLDDRAAALALTALDSSDVHERTMAAAALHGWSGAVDWAPRLARHLDDAWPVAVRAAQALRSMGDAGRAALALYAGRTDQAGQLARHMLWELDVRV
jgi:HEAT repeat protein